MPVTIIDVAKRAGVSKSTVSLVINDSPLIKDETKLRVREAIRELKYVPNIAARNLSIAKTSLIGIVILQEQSSDAGPFFDREPHSFSQAVATGIPRSLEGQKYSLVTEYYHAEKEGRVMPKLIESRRVDGVILIGGLYSDEMIREAKDVGIPMVAVGRDREGLDSVFADSRSGIRIATERVIDGGAKTLCYINCPKGFRSHEDRRLGFYDACEAHPDTERRDVIISCETNSGRGGYNAIRELWESGVHPDAIVAANDTVALGVMRFLYEMDLKIPRDVSIIGYDSSLLSEYATPALTSVDISKEKTGEIAAKLLMERIEKPGSDVRKVRIEPVLLERDTVRKKTH